MTRKQLLEVIPRENWYDEIICHSLVIIPTRRKHDSGYRKMDFVAINSNQEPICRLSGYSDVLDIMESEDFKHNTFTRAMCIDCLPKSGLLRLWSPYHNIKCGPALSSFEISLTKSNK